MQDQATLSRKDNTTGGGGGIWDIHVAEFTPAENIFPFFRWESGDLLCHVSKAVSQALLRLSHFTPRIVTILLILHGMPLGQSLVLLALKYKK